MAALLLVVYLVSMKKILYWISLLVILFSIVFYVLAFYEIGLSLVYFIRVDRMLIATLFAALTLLMTSTATNKTSRGWKWVLGITTGLVLLIVASDIYQFHFGDKAGAGYATALIGIRFGLPIIYIAAIGLFTSERLQKSGITH